MTFDVAKVAKPTEQCLLKVRVGGGGEITQTRRPRSLLRARRKRPCRRTTEQRYELAAFHSITSSARASTFGGISRPRIFAAVRLITSSNFVGNSSGTSPGLTPFKILSTKVAARRQLARRSIP